MNHVTLIDHWPGVTVGNGTGLGSSLFKLAAAADAHERGFSIDLVTSPEKAELVAGSPVLRRIACDVVELPDLSRTVALGIAAPAGVPFTEADRARYKATPHLTFWRSHLADRLGYESPRTPARYPLILPEEPLLPRGAWAGVCTDAVGRLKPYPHWGEVVPRLLEHLSVVLLGKEPDEVEATLDLRGRISIRDLVGVVAGCAVVAGSDGLATNLAMALGRPAVALFGMIAPGSVVDPDRASSVTALVQRGCPRQFCYPTLSDYRTASCPLDPDLPPGATVRCMQFPPERVAGAILERLGMEVRR